MRIATPFPACDPGATLPAAAPFGLGLIGAGAIGRMHAERCLRHPEVQLVGIADPTESGRTYGEGIGVPWFADHRAMLDAGGLSAVLVATPNASHLAIGLDCIERGLPVLMEKPIADTLDSARQLCEAAETAGVALLVAHHRRCNPITRRAKALIDEGLLGRPVCATVQATWLKPDDYFDLAWRREPGGGPVLINLIHDIDQLRFLLGEVGEVQAITSHAVRGFVVEDTAAVILRMRSGALATLCVSDAAVTPWNWDLGAGEAAHYPRQAIDSCHLSGTEASLTLPGLSIWRHDGARGWHEPLTQTRTILHDQDPYMAQLSHLRAVAEGREAPLCSGRDGLGTLAVALAVHEAARTQRPVMLKD